ncbi:MAG: hypothetical protein IKV91_00660 [Bacteroidales bacterium]|nr:hypothetical protein [Bacteroidales bacterium]
MEQLAKFVSDHLGDDTSKLLLARGKWPEIDMDLAVNCIESRRKLKGKVQDWYENPRLIFPAKLSAEQCSSSATGRYKAALAERIAGTSGQVWKIADLTGGLGVDSWFFSQRASKVLYNEMQDGLCNAAVHNFRVLEADNIVVSNNAVGNAAEQVSPTVLLSEFGPDIVYMDPARRGEGGKKVFLIEECTPDVLTLREEIFKISRHILIKLSPMADISMVCDRLGPTCREVHVVATGGECKELLIWMDREWAEEYHIHAVELPADYPESEPSVFTFRPSEERGSTARTVAMTDLTGNDFLFEPGKAMMKAGAYNLVSTRMDILKLGKSTHYYIFADSDKINILKSLGKVYEILRCQPLDKRTMKTAGKDFPKAEVTSRNLPMDTDTLRKKLGVISGDDAHIFGLKSDSQGNLILCTRRI